MSWGMGRDGWVETPTTVVGAVDVQETSMSMHRADPPVIPTKRSGRPAILGCSCIPILRLEWAIKRLRHAKLVLFFLELTVGPTDGHWSDGVVEKWQGRVHDCDPPAGQMVPIKRNDME